MAASSTTSTDFSGRGGFGAPSPNKSKTKINEKQPERRVTKPQVRDTTVGLDDFRVALMRSNLEAVKKFVNEGM